MKKKFLENIVPPVGSSFNWLIEPRLNDFYYWHSHPEFELVLIEADSGKRKIGDHSGSFKVADMVLIGSNIPHLNFDYGITGQYSHTVLHLHPDFINNLGLPELNNIQKLMVNASKGVLFDISDFQTLISDFKLLHTKSFLDQYIGLIRLLDTLANTKNIEFLHQKAFELKQKPLDELRLKKVYKLIETSYSLNIELDTVSKLCNMSKATFCRYFKKMTHLTFTEFVNNYRINIAKKHLEEGDSIADTCFKCGFESVSYFTRTFKKIAGLTPISYKHSK